MEVKIFENNQAAAEAVAAMITETIMQKPDAVICMASGDSPKKACAVLCDTIKKRQIDSSRLFLIGLDEWVGLAPELNGSCRNDFQQRLIAPLDLQAEQYHFFDALAADLEDECAKMERSIAGRGGIDIMVVGIGMNGHIGFNEPGVSFKQHAHVISLDTITTTVGQKYFSQAVSLNKGITLGLADLMEARKVILIANGSHKAPVVKQAIEGPVAERFPATILQRHPNAFVCIDQLAAADLSGPVMG